jgi:GMP synthase-like glutamine amidotransferase
MGNDRGRVRVLLLSCNQDEELNTSLVRQFARAAKLEMTQLTLHPVIDRVPTAALLSGMDAVFITGAPYSVFEEVPNMDALVETIKAAREKDIPILGVCFGAQLLAKIYGGEVVRDNAHSEWGTFDVSSTDESFGDIIFADAPFVFPVMQAHQDRISRIPPSATLLASSARCANQAFVIPGADIYGLQFHPERNVADYEERLKTRGTAYAGSDATPDQIRATLKETTAAEALVATFIDRMVMQRR